MMRRLCFLLLLLGTLCGARVITYTATSEVSGKEADEQALAGISSQIRVRVSSERTASKSEVSGQKSSLQKNYAETIRTSSDVILEHVELERKHSGKVWETTATFDTEKATAPLRKKMRELRREASAQDSLLNASVETFRFDEILNAKNRLEEISAEYKNLAKNVELLEPLAMEENLRIDDARIREKISKALSSLEISLGKDSLSVVVKSSGGPVEGMSVIALLDQKKIAEQKTGNAGVAKFSSADFETSPGEHVRIFRIAIPGSLQDEFVRNAVPEIREKFMSKAKGCALNLRCDADADVCSQISKTLSSAGFALEKSGKDLSVQIQTKHREKFEGGARALFRVELSLEFIHGDFRISKKLLGTGSTESLAEKNALQKIKPATIYRELSPICEEK